MHSQFSVPDDSEAVATISLDHCYSSAKGTILNLADNNSMSSEIDSSDSATTTSRSSNNAIKSSLGNKSPNNKRRSQRQIDKIEMETLKRIRAENEQLLKKEKEVLMLQNNVIKPKEECVAETDVLPDSVPVLIVAASSPIVEETKQSHPLSRLATIRQELQQKILNVESPVSSKISPKIRDPVAKSDHQTTGSKNEMPSVGKEQSVNENNDQSTIGNIILPARPRRENRQPPKHLREAFDRMEFEAVTAVALKKTATGNTSPSKTTSIVRDIPVGTGTAEADLSGTSEHISEKEDLENSVLGKLIKKI